MPEPLPWAVGVPAIEGYTWKAQSPRAAVLLMHGFGEYAGRYVQHYSGLIPALCAAGFDVYAFDMRGHGHSLGRRAVVNVDTLVQDHLHAREQLRRQTLPVFALGHSLGGLVTALSAARDARGLSGLILSSPALLVGEDEPAALRRTARLLAQMAPSLPVKSLDTEHLSRRPSEVTAYRQDPLVYQGKVPALTAASMMRASAQGWRDYPALRVPTLVVHGSDDHITAPAGSQRFIDLLAASDKTLHTAEGGYHELLNDDGSAETLAVILDWLDRHAPPRPAPQHG